MEMYRQGDVLLVRQDFNDETLAAWRAAATGIDREGGNIVLAHGEVTGHAHAVAEPQAEFIELGDGKRLLLSPVRFEVRHEEHAALDIPPGVYQVIRQKEYTPKAPRFVAD